MATATDVTVTEGDDAQIRKLIERRNQAMMAKDLDAIMATYASDVVAFDFIPPLRFVGVDAYRKSWEWGLSMFEGPGEFEQRDLTIAASGDVGYAHALLRMGPPGNAKWMRWTACFRKVRGKWLTTHEHYSAPIDVTTGEVQMDLQP